MSKEQWTWCSAKIPTSIDGIIGHQFKEELSLLLHANQSPSTAGF
jgi:hypothetical protein